MTTPWPIAFLAGLLACAFCQWFLPRGRQLPPRDQEGWEPAPVGMGLWVGLALATAVLWLLREELPGAGDLKAGPAFGAILPAAAPLLIATLISDFGRPHSERHALGLVGSGLGLHLAGMSILLLFGMELAPVWQAVATVVWLFLLASILELAGLAPGGLAALGLAVAAFLWLSGGDQQSVASYTLAGVAGGGAVGREIAGRIGRRPAPLGKSEVFALGLWLTAATNAAFLKSATFAAFVLPLGTFAVALIIVSIRAFERTLLLRAGPR